MHIYFNNNNGIYEMVTLEKMARYLAEKTGKSVSCMRKKLRAHKENKNGLDDFTVYTDYKAYTVRYHWNCPLREKWSVVKIA